MTDEQKYAHARLSAMVKHEWPELYPASLLRADVAMLLDFLAAAQGARVEKPSNVAKAWARMEAEFLPALAHHFSPEDDAEFLAPIRAAIAAEDALADHIIRVFGDQTHPSMAIRALLAHARAGQS